MNNFKKFFVSEDVFNKDEWMLEQQILALRSISFFFGFGVLVFAILRLMEGNLIVGLSQLFLGIYLLIGFVRLKNNKNYYYEYSIGFMIFFFLYTTIIFFCVPQNHLNILWVISAPILIFFFLNRSAGVIMFALVLIFIMYLMLSGYSYNIAEYVTLLAAFFVTSFVMYIYEKVKEGEKNRFLLYSHELEKEVESKTADLNKLNIQLKERVQEEVKQRLAQKKILLFQSRMASMGEMIDAIAHQWRQPLMNISAVMMNLDRGIELGKEAPELKDKVLEVFALTAHMSSTIEDFRNLLKMNKHKSTFMVDELISNTLTLIKNNLKGTDVICNYKKDISIDSYKSELVQVLITILGNAAEALNMEQISDKKIVITIDKTRDFVTIGIEDNAGGIDNSILPKIFEPNFTTKKQIGGTGIGLYIAKIIIEDNMKGKLIASNTPKGALFTIRIPIV